MARVTVEHVLGFIDGRMCKIRDARGAIGGLDGDAEAYGRLAAYEELKAYILIEGADPE